MRGCALPWSALNLRENLSLRYIRGALEHAGHEAVQIDFNHRLT